MSGTVYLVGAGPGAADLLTVRAARLLAEAEIVFHDALIGPEILALAPQAEKVAVGKRCGRHATTQVFINKRLAEAARRCRTVLRLKGGDPLLFGRAQEEIAFLHARGIRVEVVPGITSALAAGAAVAVSLTRRGIARSVVFATPRVAPGEPPSAWATAVANGDTAALYMAAHDAAAVRKALVEAGMPSRTPVLLAANVSLQNEKLMLGRLGELPALAEQAGAAPALLLLGQVFAEACAGAGEARSPRLASQSA